MGHPRGSLPGFAATRPHYIGIVDCGLAKIGQPRRLSLRERRQSKRILHRSFLGSRSLCLVPQVSSGFWALTRVKKYSRRSAFVCVSRFRAVHSDSISIKAAVAT
jgi:hypothetical protein